MSLISNIKNLFALTATLFILTACGGGGGSGTLVDTSENGDTLAASTTEPTPKPTSSITLEPEVIPVLETTSSPTISSITEPEPILPVINSNPSLKITSIEEIETAENSARIKWELTEKATGQIEYGFDTSYGNVTIPEESFDYATHVQRLTYLEPDSLYHYRVISEDPNGNRVVSEDRTFKTKSDGTVTLELVQEPEPISSSVNQSATTAPEGATVISGLQSGATTSAALNNSNVLNTVLSGGNKNLIIPSGEWYTLEQVNVYRNTTLTFASGAKLHQLPDSSYNFQKYHKFVMITREGNITLNNPHLTQQGIVSTKPGTHACLAAYGSFTAANITINGGILEWGASNGFQGGRSNTVFNGTIFRNSVEHTVYGNGLIKDANGNYDASNGLTFNDCIFENPGNGLWADVEANHIQIRNYKNVEFNNCITKGSPHTSQGNIGINFSGVSGATFNGGSIKDYTSVGVFTAEDSKYNLPFAMENVVFNGTTFEGNGVKSIRRSPHPCDVTFNNCTFVKPSAIERETNFNNCTFKTTNYFMKVGSSKRSSNSTFYNCTWDASDSTYSRFLDVESGSIATFTGTQTKIAPTGGKSFTWGPLLTTD